MNITLCVLCIAGTQKIFRESCRRKLKPHSSISATPNHAVSSLQYTVLYSHKATTVPETAFPPNCIIDQPEERGLSIPSKSQSQKNKDTLAASWQSFHEILPASTIREIKQIVVRLWIWKLHVFLHLCCKRTCTGKLFFMFQVKKFHARGESSRFNRKIDSKYSRDCCLWCYTRTDENRQGWLDPVRLVQSWSELRQT